ncbi:hypothetical protein KKE26_12345 [bacterium]|nr:hypothetical protein [bacterium]MBU1752512.1 hypothetical protein [bacterium]
MNNMHTITQRNKMYNLKFILGLLNSQLLNYYFQWLNPEKGEALAEIKKEHVESLVIKATSEKQRNQIIEIVDKILAITQDDDYLTNPTKQSQVKDYSHQIDHLVYELYNLTKDEIAIIENSGGKQNQGPKPGKTRKTRDSDCFKALTNNRYILQRDENQDSLFERGLYEKE